MIQTSVETITPIFAEQALKLNGKNRKIDKMILLTYAGAIERGEWVMNGEPIIFDEAGHVLDGQHRLHGVVKAKKPIQSLVVRGIDRETFPTLDSGKRRNVSDVLSTMGYQYVVASAAAARAILYIEAGSMAARTRTNLVMIDIIKAHPTIPEWAALWTKAPIRTFMPAVFAGVCALAAERHGNEKVFKFFQDVSEGIGLDRTNPAHVLRERFIVQTRGNKVPTESRLPMMIKAMNSAISGNPIRILKIAKGEEFPTLL